MSIGSQTNICVVITKQFEHSFIHCWNAIELNRVLPALIEHKADFYGPGTQSKTFESF